MARPGEKVILKFKEEPPKGYTIVHLNECDSKTASVLEGIARRGIFIADYWLEKDHPQGYFIMKSYNSKEGLSDGLVVPKESQIEEELHKFASEEAQKYAESKGLEFEDHSDFIPNPFPPR